MKKKGSEQSGRTMFEAMGYISIGIMLSVSIATAVNSGYFRFRIGRMHQELMDLKKVVSQRYVAADSYNGINFDKMIEEKIIPFELRNKRHSFGGDVEIGAGDANGETFYIKFSSVPEQACVELGSILWVVNDGSDLDAMDINGTVWGWKYSSSFKANNIDKDLPARAVDVSQACNPICKDDEGKIIDCPDNDRYITWYFT